MAYAGRSGANRRDGQPDLTRAGPARAATALKVPDHWKVGGRAADAARLVGEMATTQEPQIHRSVGTRTCVFCGASGLTREHVLAQWISKELATLYSPDFVGFAADMQLGRLGPEQPRRQWEAPDLSHTSRHYCASCNNGWMAGLEGEVKPILGPMIRGEHINLWQQDVLTLARWAAKTTVVAQHVDPLPDAPGHESYGWIKDGTTPQGRLWVALGRYSGWREGTTILSQAHRSGEGTSGTQALAGELLTLRVGHVVLQAFLWESQDSYPIEIAEPSDLLMQVWPSSSLVLTWPPPQSLSETQVGLLHERFLVP